MEELENILGYKFRKKDLLRQALTHPSMSFRGSSFNYERMEFLGDSLLSMVIVEYLYKKHTKENEGQLSRRKAYLVSKEILYEIALSLNLGKFIIMTKGEENCGGRTNINNLENVMESVLAAIYLDSSSIAPVRRFVIKMWEPIDLMEKKPYSNPKTRLQEWTQKYYKALPEYTVLKKDVIDNNDHFLVKLTIPNGMTLEDDGLNIKKIEENLAENMLKKLKI